MKSVSPTVPVDSDLRAKIMIRQAADLVLRLIHGWLESRDDGNGMPLLVREAIVQSQSLVMGVGVPADVAALAAGLNSINKQMVRFLHFSALSWPDRPFWAAVAALAHARHMSLTSRIRPEL